MAAAAIVMLQLIELSINVVARDTVITFASSSVDIGSQQRHR